MSTQITGTLQKVRFFTLFIFLFKNLDLFDKIIYNSKVQFYMRV